ncbi:hypothetical protein J4422_00400 [Candidatus Pacearchaeota archaeon]|nr:hypothetical protein [Candidatus Pacearchaeota archaeon]
MKKITKVFIMMFIAVISFLLYAPFLNQKILDYGEYDCCNLTISSREGIFDKPTLFNTIKKVTSPFDLKYYNLYLSFSLKENPACYLVYPNILTYQIDNETRSIIRGDREFVKTIRFDESYNIVLSNFTYNTTDIKDYIAYRNISVPEGQIISSISTEITVGKEVNYLLISKMTWFDAIGNMFIFFLFWIGIILLIKSLIEWIKER